MPATLPPELEIANAGHNDIGLHCEIANIYTTMAIKPTPNAPPGHEGDTATKEKPQQTKPPPMWQVVMYNDDYTPMDFVINVLENLFGHPYERAAQIMLQIHTEGRGVCGVFPRDVALMKVEQVGDYARKYQHPLRCVMEEV